MSRALPSMYMWDYIKEETLLTSFCKMLGLLTVVTLFLGALGHIDLGKVSSEGYPVETHKVTTKDGYILQLVRIPHGRNSTDNSKGVVFLMHGLPFGSPSFTYLGSDYGMAQNLADARYDVWMGNFRGNIYSRNHTSKNPDDPKSKFYDFGLDELGLIDLPTMMDCILQMTNTTKLHYFGHSLGGTAFYILNSLKPEYQSKFASANILSGLGYATELPNKVVKGICLGIDVIYTTALAINLVEFNPANPLTITTSQLFMGTLIPPELIAGTSVKLVTHYSQNFRDDKFRRFDYKAGNMFKYGRLFPPSYDLTKIRVNTTLHYSVGDPTQSEKDVLLMVNDMPNARARKIPDKTWKQPDYLVNPRVKDYVTDYIIESMGNSSNS